MFVTTVATMKKFLLFCALTTAATPAAWAQAHESFFQPPVELEKPAGYLCCNMRSAGGWISDINYEEDDARIVPLGTPLKVTGYGRYRAFVEIGGKRQALGNDYSRDLPLDVFAKRYVVKDNPLDRLSTFPAPIQQAIRASKLKQGMTREQVLMAVGYPVTSENPKLDAKVWRFWLSSFSEFRVRFNDAGLVERVDADAGIEDKVIQP